MSIEDLCEIYGHPYCGSDDSCGYCYCGAKRYPRGGPIKCIACGVPADSRLCPECRAEVDERTREMVEERRQKTRGRVRW